MPKKQTPGFKAARETQRRYQAGLDSAQGLKKRSVAAKGIAEYSKSAAFYNAAMSGLASGLSGVQKKANPQVSKNNAKASNDYLAKAKKEESDYKTYTQMSKDLSRESFNTSAKAYGEYRQNRKKAAAIERASKKKR